MLSPSAQLSRSSDSDQHPEPTLSLGLQRLFKPNGEGWTPLHSAAAGRHHDALKRLLEAGLSPKLTDQTGKQALHIAAAAGDLEAVSLLILHMAQPDARKDIVEEWRRQKDEEWRRREFEEPFRDPLEELRRHLPQERLRREDKERRRREFEEWCCQQHEEWLDQDLLPILATGDHRGFERMPPPEPKALNTRDKNDQTALHLAAENGHSRVLQRLLRIGADANLKDEQGRTALHLLARRYSILKEQPLSCNTDANARDRGHGEAIQLIERILFGRKVPGVSKNSADIDITDGNGQTALHMAAESGPDSFVAFLLGKRADVKIKDGRGQTALFLAVKHRGSGIVERMLRFKGIVADGKDEEDRTALHLAAQRGLDRVVHRLLEKPTEMDARDKRGRTALHLAAGHGDDKVVQQLLEKGAKTDVEDGEGRTALHLAAGRGHDKVVQQLLEKAPETYPRDREGRTALLLAAESRHVGIVQRLLEVGARTDARDRRGRTAFHIAAENGDEGVMQQLLKYSVETDAEDGEGRTALHLAAELGRDGIIRQLLENGAQPSDRAGQKVLELVRKKVKPDVGRSTMQDIGEGEQILRLLFEKDTKRDVDVNTDEGLKILGWTTEIPIERARWEMAEQVAKLLVSHGAEANRTIPTTESTALWLAVAHAHKTVLAVVLGARDLIREGEGKAALKKFMEDIKNEQLVISPNKLKLLKEALEEGSASY